MGVLHTPLRIGGATVRNRLYRAPVLEGAGSGPEAADVYAKAFVENARNGVGLIIQGSSCIYEEGRSSPGMTLVHERERVLALAPMVDAVHAEGASIFLQIGHAGIYSMEAWHEPYASQRKGPIRAVSPLPLPLRVPFRGVPIKVLSTDEVRGIAVQHGEVAAWARCPAAARQGWRLAQQRTGIAGVDDLFDHERLGRAKRRAHQVHAGLDVGAQGIGVVGLLDLGLVGRPDAALERQRSPVGRGPRVPVRQARSVLMGRAGHAAHLPQDDGAPRHLGLVDGGQRAGPVPDGRRLLRGGADDEAGLVDQVQDRQVKGVRQVDEAGDLQ